MSDTKPQESQDPVIDQRMQALMHEILLENLVSPNGGFVRDKESRIGKTRESDEIRATINGQQYVLIVPTGIKQAPALERRIREYNRQHIATRVIVPESSDGYVGRHIVHLGEQKVPQANGTVKHYHLSVLSSIVKHMADKYGGRSVYTFNIAERTLRTMVFEKRLADDVAIYLGQEPYSEEKGDDALVEFVRELRKLDRSKGYLYRALDEEDRGRFMELGWIRDDQCTVRGRFKPEELFKFAKPDSKRKKFYTLRAEQHHTGLWLAHIVEVEAKNPYGPQKKGSDTTGDLFAQF